MDYSGKSEVGGDICCENVLLPLVNKEAAFDQWFNWVKAD